MEELSAILLHADTCQICSTILEEIDTGEDSKLGESLFELNITPNQEEPIRQVCQELRTKVLDYPKQTAKPPKLYGDYEVYEQIGRGGMGVIYRAKQIHMGKFVALKALSQSMAINQESLKRFEQEIMVLSDLDHPNIVKATNAFRTNDGSMFLVMEYINGVDLHNLVKNVGRLPVGTACEIIRQSALGLHHVHEKDVVHRDIKPSNLMLNTTGVVKVLDLGVAAVLDSSYRRRVITAENTALGTLDYMAPESGYASKHLIGSRSDIYSLGCTLYYLLTGKPPYDTHGGLYLRKEFLNEHRYAKIPDIRQIRKDIPVGLAKLITKMLAKLPQDRPKSADEIATELEKYADNRSLSELCEECLEKIASKNISESDIWPMDSISQHPTMSLRSSRKRKQRAFGIVSCFVASLLFVAAIARPDAIYSVQKPPVDSADTQHHATSGIRLPDTIDKLVKPGWHDLLAKEPTPIVWDRDDIHNTYTLKDRQLVLDTVKGGKLKLGEIHDSKYEIHMKFRQPAWTGRFGMYIGGSNVEMMYHYHKFSFANINFFNPRNAEHAVYTYQQQTPLDFNVGIDSSVGSGTFFVNLDPDVRECSMMVECDNKEGVKQILFNEVPIYKADKAPYTDRFIGATMFTTSGDIGVWAYDNVYVNFTQFMVKVLE